MRKIVFTTSTDPTFFRGTVALCKSIRKFYPNLKEAKIVVTANDITSGLLTEMNGARASVIAMPNVMDARKVGKAFATMAGLNEAKLGDILIHIDSDAWLLGRLDQLLDSWEPEENDMLAWNDKNGKGVQARHIETHLACHCVPTKFDQMKYNFNAEIILYCVGDNTKELVDDFFRCCQDPRINNDMGNQGIIRACAAKYLFEDKINFILSKDSAHYNPIWSAADAIELREDKWFNLKTGKQQFIFHATGGKSRKIGQDKPWQRPEEWTECVMQSLRWATQ